MSGREPEEPSGSQARDGLTGAEIFEIRRRVPCNSVTSFLLPKGIAAQLRHTVRLSGSDPA
eukprot:636427-Rhodomonas_salina.3